MASQSAANSTSSSYTSSSTLPSSLSFLIANFQSFITIKLESANYFAWKTQVENALKANDLFEFAENTAIIPSSHVLDSSGTKIPNPDYARWLTIDRMLLSCLIATLNPSVLPHIVGSNHTYQFWSKLEEKFSLLSRSHVHDLKRRLYSLNKTGTVDDYLDLIKGIVQKLAASGHYVEDEDLIFHALNGLKTGYDSFKQAIRTRTEPISFGTFSSMLLAEDLHIENDLKLANTTSVLVAQTSITPSSGLSSSVSNPSGQTTSVPLLPTPLPYQFPFPPQQYFPSVGGNNRSNRNNSRFNRNQSSNQNHYPFQYPSSSSGGGCQICGKSNHLAYACHHRQNLAYRPNFGNQNGGYGNNSGHNFNARPPMYNNTSGYNSGYGGNSGHGGTFGQSMGCNGNSGFGDNIGQPLRNSGQSMGYNGNSGFGDNFGQPLRNSGNTNAQAMFTSPDAMGYYGYDGYNMPAVPSSFDSVPNTFPQQPHVKSGYGDFTTAQPSNSWFFDSGATSHVTYDPSHIQTSNGGQGANAVTVGNGQSIPVTKSGQSHTPDSASRGLPQGSLPPASFL